MSVRLRDGRIGYVSGYVSGYVISDTESIRGDFNRRSPAVRSASAPPLIHATTFLPFPHTTPPTTATYMRNWATPRFVADSSHGALTSSSVSSLASSALSTTTTATTTMPTSHFAQPLGRPPRSQPLAIHPAIAPPLSSSSLSSSLSRRSSSPIHHTSLVLPRSDATRHSLTSHSSVSRMSKKSKSFSAPISFRVLRSGTTPATNSTPPIQHTLRSAKQYSEVPQPLRVPVRKPAVPHSSTFDTADDNDGDDDGADENANDDENETEVRVTDKLTRFGSVAGGRDHRSHLELDMTSEHEDVDVDETYDQSDASRDTSSSMETGTDEAVDTTSRSTSLQSALVGTHLERGDVVGGDGGGAGRDSAMGGRDTVAKSLSSSLASSSLASSSPAICVVPTWVQFACALLASPCDPQRTLVALDIDETIVQCRYEHPPLVSSDPRTLPEFQWLRELVTGRNGIEQKRLMDAFQVAYRNTLHEKVLTEQIVPFVIQELRKRGFTIFGFTTRSFRHQRDVTIHSLTTLGIELGPNPFSKREFRDERSGTTCADGIVWTNGCAKGPELFKLMTHLQQTSHIVMPDHLVFIDNLEANVRSVRDVCSALFVVHGYHYRPQQTHIRKPALADAPQLVHLKTQTLSSSLTTPRA